MSISALAIKKVILPVTYNPNYHITKQVLALYRSKLRIASKMGYKIGSGAERTFINNTMFDDDKIHTYARKLYVGKMTWSHIMARLMLVEQLYRIECILNNHPYHK